jgi:hypothetical protein
LRIWKYNNIYFIQMDEELEKLNAGDEMRKFSDYFEYKGTIG